MAQHLQGLGLAKEYGTKQQQQQQKTLPYFIAVVKK